jgi:hypothetical protein
MTQLLLLRQEVSKKLGISLRQLRNRVIAVSVRENILDRTVALLYIASKEARLNIKLPRYKVPASKISALEAILTARTQGSVVVPPGTATKKATKEQPVKYRRLLNFKGKYPMPVFYDPLEDEINTAYSDPALPNAVLLLSRKLIENLVYNLLENRFSGIQTELYYNTGQMRAHDFSVLLDNLRKRKSDFDADQQENIGQFLKIMDETKFRREANSATHKVMEYLDSMREIQRFKIPHMVQILLHLIERVREPKSSLKLTNGTELF